MVKPSYQIFGYVRGREVAVACRSATKGCSAGSSRRGAHAGTNGESTTLVSRNNRRLGETDWAAVDALGDAEIAAAARADPGMVPLDFDWSKAVLIVAPRKKAIAISIRLDEDVLDFFRSGAPAINAA